MRRSVFIFTLIAVVVVALGAVFFVRVAPNRLSIIQSGFTQRLIPLYRSVRKIPDIVFFPRYVLSKSKLERFEIIISPADVERMNALLPKNPFGNVSLDDAQKLWVPATFVAKDYQGKVDIRYRGNLANHWNSYQKSYLIEFPKDNLYHGMREMALVIPSDRNYFSEALNTYRAKKLGLWNTEEHYVRVRFNGAPAGVYMAFENWSQEWVEKHPMSALSILYGIMDVSNSVDPETLPHVYSEEALQYWRNWNGDPLYFDPVTTLVELVDNADDATFKKLLPVMVDIESFYALDVMSILSGGFHAASPKPGASNIVLLFDGAEGRFTPVPYNVGLFLPEEQILYNVARLQERIWTIPEFKAARDAMFRTYVANEKEDDLVFIDQWLSDMKPEFYSDTAKIDNNFSFWKKIKAYRAAAESYFDDPFGQIEKDLPVEVVEEPLTFPKSFAYLKESAVSVSAFTARYPQFTQSGRGIEISGDQYLAGTIVIPYGTRLYIAPGTTLRMGPAASLLSYSPVTAEGTATRPITVISSSASSWGVFGVLNTEKEKNVFRYVTFKGGGEATINGVYMSGMLALHNSDADIQYSRFEGTTGDDALNVKRGQSVVIEHNVFTRNAFDAIDLDYVASTTKLAQNLFIDNGGDSMDLSWTDIVIENNTVIGCGDKGVSVGESSNPTIRNNILAKCDLGVAVKDSSKASIENNYFIKNRIAVALYRKKEFFNGGYATLTTNTLWENHRDFDADTFSHYDQGNILSSRPDLPVSAELSKLIFQ